MCEKLLLYYIFERLLLNVMYVRRDVQHLICFYLTINKNCQVIGQKAAIWFKSNKPIFLYNTSIIKAYIQIHSTWAKTDVL